MATFRSSPHVIAGGAVRAAHLLPIIPVATEVIPSMSVAVATWDEAYTPLDAILIWDGEQVAQAAMGALHTMVEPLLASEALRMLIVIAAPIAPLPDGSSELAGQRRRLHWNALQSALLTAQELGIGISYCHHEQMIPHCQMLLNRDRRPIIARRGYHPMGDQIAWLAGIGGIGIDTARAVVEYCGGDFSAALMALTDPAIPPPPAITPARWRALQRTCRQWLKLPEGVRMSMDTVELKQEDNHAA